jgi:hypothetical protein
MKQEVIEDFLNLPGIAGVALMDRRSRPYFCGVDRTLNFQQKEALATGILQVLETIPEEFEGFKFHFSGHQVHIYKLDHGIILLVLTRENLVFSDYSQTIKNLKAALREDIANAIARFRLIAGNLTLSKLGHSQQELGQPQQHLSPLTSQNGETPNLFTETRNGTSCLQVISAPLPNPAGDSQTPYPNQPSSLTHPPPETLLPTAEIASSHNLNDLLLALNHLNKFTNQYLGTSVIVNYWKTTRPQHSWLNNFQIDRSAQVSFANITAQELQSPLKGEELQWIREWVLAFIQRCAQAMRDFPTLVEGKALTSEQKALLLG